MIFSLKKPEASAPADESSDVDEAKTDDAGAEENTQDEIAVVEDDQPVEAEGDSVSEGEDEEQS